MSRLAPIVVAFVLFVLAACGADAEQQACPSDAGCPPCPDACGDHRVYLHGAYAGVVVCLWTEPTDAGDGGSVVVETLVCREVATAQIPVTNEQGDVDPIAQVPKTIGDAAQ
jgi:hypothetical protein